MYNKSLKLIMRRILEIDEFIAQLWKVHLQVKQEGYTQVRLLQNHPEPVTDSVCRTYR